MFQIIRCQMINILQLDHYRINLTSCVTYYKNTEFHNTEDIRYQIVGSRH